MERGDIAVGGIVFVLTGKMWAERAAIEKQIRGLGGSTAAKVQGGDVVLVVADNATIGPGSTSKVRDAEQHGARIVRECELKRALLPSDVQRDEHETASVLAEHAKQVAERNRMRRLSNAAALDLSKLDETSKLLAGF